MIQLLEDFDFIEKLTSKPPSLNISFFRSNVLVMESLLYDESTPNNINCGLRRIGLDIEKLAKSSILESSWLSLLTSSSVVKQIAIPSLLIFLILVILKGRFLLSRKEIILLRVEGEPALSFRGLTKRTFSLGGGGMVKKKTAAGKKRPVRS
ncbi:hypothetical protein TNCV_2578011 [Trichonephila clavipes]|nr:hypothetical protein TNCV_2578011 [Trichonephila clavipes]